MWVVNNEGWGQYDSATLARYVKGMDPSRLVDADSGWLDVAPEASDVLDIHTYEDVPHTPAHQANRAIVMGEYGGIGLPVEGHIWRPGRSEEHTSELPSLMRISYAVFCLKKKNTIQLTKRNKV